MKTTFTAIGCGLLALTMSASAATPVSKKADLAGADTYLGARKTATRADDSETWKSIGMGHYRDNAIHEYYGIYSWPEVEVEIEESETTPGRYRIKNPYVKYPDLIGGAYTLEGDHYITIDASDPVHVFIEVSQTGYVIGEGQELVLWSKADDYYNNRFGNWDLADQEGICGKVEEMAITFPRRGVLATLYEFSTGLPFDPDAVYRGVNGDGMFRVKLPGAPDLEYSVEAPTIDGALTTLTYKVTVGASAEKTLVALVPGKYEESMDADIISGKTPSIEVAKSGNIEIAYPGDGSYTLVMVPYWDGKPCRARFYDHELTFDQSEWRKVGPVEYTEGILAANEVFDYNGVTWGSYTYPVELEENVHNPGLLRLVDPYGEPYPYASSTNYDSSTRHYLVINATRPDAVYLEHMEDMGLNLGYGVMEIWSRAGRRMVEEVAGQPILTLDQCREEGLTGTLANNEITFPKDMTYMKFGVAPTLWYYSNQKGEFKVKLQPGQIVEPGSGIDSVISGDENAPARYYTLDGMEADGANLAPGIYIVRQGSRASKIMVR